jgi:cyclase
LIAKVASQVFIPFCVGGGIGTIDDIRSTILAGAEKVSLNSQAVKNPSLITEGARIFGNQCIVLGMDAAKDAEMPSGYRVYINGGRIKTDIDALEWAKKAVSLGAGEIVLNSMDADGTKDGYEINLTRMIAENVPVPVIASGGGGTPQHLATVLTEGKADAALIATMVHSGQYTVGSIKEELKKQNIPVR